ncbi:MAG TPA: YggS family pyridoxal phosphate-dependent enzyme [Ignavibacteria bacterium]|nr:YggS family pyridoxal phosphate-dependent enzyme [Ignavibacteria bacterium]HRA99867.1 YggS family pyridoxal phosphate-dependent enzyme [Ignavibacteria bacterium]
MKILSNFSSLKERIKEVCETAGRDPEEITIVAVSKTFPFTRIIELNSIGHVDFGENKIREMRDKYYNISFQYSGKINWHMVGHLQSNKVKDIIAFIHLIHSVDTFNLAEVIDSTAKRINRKIDILVQVNTSNEEQKYGVLPEEAESLCKQISLLENINVKGLMTIARLTDDRDEIRRSFRTLRELFDKMKSDFSDFKYLSMGMTNDFDIAIEEGSNMLRIGSAIFGERPVIVE